MNIKVSPNQDQVTNLSSLLQEQSRQGKPWFVNLELHIAIFFARYISRQDLYHCMRKVRIWYLLYETWWAKFDAQGSFEMWNPSFNLAIGKFTSHASTKGLLDITDKELPDPIDA